MNRKELARAIIEDVARVSRELGAIPSERKYLESRLNKFSREQVKSAFSTWTTALKAAGLSGKVELKPAPEEKREPKILFFDIETAPIKGFVWGMWENNLGINQIDSDWHLLSWAAKWLGSSEILYMDQRKERVVSNDKKLLAGLWELLNEADVVISQNGKAFDEKKANARFIMQGLPPTSPYKHIDTKQLAKKRFAFTSNRLEYLAEALGVKHKKLKHKEFPGFELWSECLKGNPRAWKEMELYNKADVLALEEVYKKLSPWGVGVDLNVFHSEATFRCQCGSSSLQRRGYNFSAAGRFQRYQCTECGAWHSSRGRSNNLMSEKKRSSIKSPKV